MRFNTDINESVLEKENARKKKIEQKTKQINFNKGSINKPKNLILPNIRSSSSLLGT